MLARFSESYLFCIILVKRLIHVNDTKKQNNNQPSKESDLAYNFMTIYSGAKFKQPKEKQILLVCGLFI